MNHSILIADDEDSIRFVLTKALQKEGYQIFAASNAAEVIDCLRAEAIDVILLDIFLGDVNGLELMEQLQQINETAAIIIITGHGTTQTAIEAAKRRAYDYVTKPFELRSVIELVSRAVNAADQAKAAMEATPDISAPSVSTQPEEGTQIVGESPAMHVVYQIIGRAAISDETVLIIGESGTGKELVAQLIHQNSQRADQPFVVFDCSAVPETLIESALFGHVKGAYTGADAARQGKFEQADGGTIFLDEVGELPIEVQMKLLRVLQEREVEPVGSNQRRRVNVRVVAATHRRLDLAIHDGEFREDLYYRLNVIPVYLPPLRERKDDIPDLVELFINRFAQEYQRPKTAISPEAFKGLMTYDWPGNVRELENTIKRALVLCSGQVLLPEHFPQLSDGPKMLTANDTTDFDNQLYTLLQGQANQYLESGKSDGSLHAEIRAAFEKPLFEIVLERTGFNRSKAASLLGINRNTLHSKMEEYGIKG
jgi:two-component system, NtrC family, nitrogen regulation response regulator GlnG